MKVDSLQLLRLYLIERARREPIALPLLVDSIDSAAQYC